MLDKKIKECIKKTFPKDNIPKKLNDLKFGAFKSWDSLAHLNLLLSIEKKFNIKFSLNEMTSLKKVSEIVKTLEKKLK